MNKNIFKSHPKLETKRFILREITSSDQTDIFDLYSDDFILTYQGINVIHSKEEAIKSIQFFKDGYKKQLFIKFGIEDKISGALIGILSLHSFNFRHNNSQIGFILRQSEWNKGIMTEVAKKVISYAFYEVELNRIEAHVHPQNIASIKLCEKLGFSKEGLLIESAFSNRSSLYEDRIVFGLTKTQYEAIQKN